MFAQQKPFAAKTMKFLVFEHEHKNTEWSTIKSITCTKAVNYGNEIPVTKTSFYYLEG